MRSLGCFLIIAGVLMPAPPPRRDVVDANAMLRRVDEYRNPLQHYTVDVELTTNHRGEKRSWDFRVYGNGADTSLLEFRTPAADKGKYYLMLRDDMWIYLPNTSRPLRISPLQRLAGEASNGDVARTSYSVDYDAAVSAEENVNGRAAYLLELKGRDTDMSYGRVKLWVAKDNGEPIQAEFYALSGRLLKRAFFREFGTLANRRTVTLIEIQDAVRPDHSTFMKYSNLVSKRYPEKMFNRNYLGKW